MNNLSRIVLSAALTALALPVASQEAERPVAVKTAGLPDHVRARIEAKAQEGPSSLIRYINSFERRLTSKAASGTWIASSAAASLRAESLSRAKSSESSGRTNPYHSGLSALFK